MTPNSIFNERGAYPSLLINLPAQTLASLSKAYLINQFVVEVVPVPEPFLVEHKKLAVCLISKDQVLIEGLLVEVIKVVL